jgi:hypothetical protein
MMGGWDDDDAGYGDPEDEEEALQAAARGRTEVQAEGESDVPEGEDGEALMKRMARSHLELAMKTLADVAANGVKDAARNTAAKELLARGFGGVTRKSEQKVDVTVTDQRKAHFDALQELAAKNPVLDITDAEFEDVAPKLTNRRRRDDDDE